LCCLVDVYAIVYPAAWIMDHVIGILTRLLAGWSRYHCWLLDRKSRYCFPIPWNTLALTGTHLAYCPMVTRGSLPRCEVAGVWTSSFTSTYCQS